MDKYETIGSKADEIESELRRLKRWTEHPLPDEKYSDMGAFGVNTMSFEQWVQFILLVRIRDIIRDKGEFPEHSSVGAYAVRALDGDDEAQDFVRLLSELDAMIEPPVDFPGSHGTQESAPEPLSDGRPILGSVENLPLPLVVYTLAELLPEYDDDQLESQLQTFNIFLSTYPQGREAIVQMLDRAALAGKNARVRLRLQKASASVAQGGLAAKEYNHDEEMRKYREEFKKNFPDKK